MDGGSLFKLPVTAASCQHATVYPMSCTIRHLQITQHSGPSYQKELLR